MASVSGRLKHAWNAFVKQDDPSADRGYDAGSTYSARPDRTRMNISNERSIVSAVYTRIGIDFAAVSMKHVRLDDRGQFESVIDSGLNNCLTLDPNIDQGSRALRQDIAMTLCDTGVIAIVPIETSIDPSSVSGGYDIKTMRVGKITQWGARKVKVNLYNDDPAVGRYQEVTLDKSAIAIVENPLYAVMNEPNSTLQRLIRKLNLLDSVDEASSSGKLDLIIQLPYVIKSEARRTQAEQRKNDIEVQLKGSKYGIAYTDATEKITQLNRPAENNLLQQVEYLTTMLYGQLGITEEVFNGTADEKTMLNYYNRTIEPLLGAVTEEMKRKFLTKTARSQRQSIEAYRDPFKLVSVSDIAEIADKLSRNEIMTGNELRSPLGLPPSKDPNADKLMNKNLPEPVPPTPTPKAQPVPKASEQTPPVQGTS